MGDRNERTSDPGELREQDWMGVGSHEGSTVTPGFGSSNWEMWVILGEKTFG